MHETYMIEISDIAVGIVISERSGYRFFASGSAFSRIDGTLYSTPHAAEKAARAIAGAAGQPGADAVLDEGAPLPS